MSALIIVDAQNDTITTSREAHDAIFIINMIREQNPWVMIVRAELSHDSEGTHTHCIKGTSGASAPSHLVTSPDDVVIYKSQPSAFNDSLATLLKAAGVKEVIICGFDTDFSIRKTAQDSMAAGFETGIFFNASHFTSKEEYLALKGANTLK
jgi:nicotinamidase-related amidase